MNPTIEDQAKRNVELEAWLRSSLAWLEIVAAKYPQNDEFMSHLSAARAAVSSTPQPNP